MQYKKKGLGKGLSTLLGDISFNQQRIDALTQEGTGDQIRQINLDALVTGQFQPRIDFDQEALQELADSIKKQGLVQPIVVRLLTDQQETGQLETTEQKYEIIAGERRWRACKIAGLARIPVIVKSLTDEQALAVALIENLQREDLNIMETAEALRQLHQDFQLNQQQIADLLGKARTTVANILRLNSLSQPVRTYLRQGRLDMGHARALIPLPPGQQIKLAEKIIAQQMNVRQTEKLVQKLSVASQEESQAQSEEQTTSQEVLTHLTDKWSQSLKTQVKIKPLKGDKGQVLIHYASLDELKRITSTLRE